MKPCQASLPGPSLCANGFPQSAVCRGYACHACGKHSDVVPACQDEDIAPMWLMDNGIPKFMLTAKG